MKRRTRPLQKGLMRGLSPRESEPWGQAPRIVKAELKGASEKGLIRHRNIRQVDLIWLITNNSTGTIANCCRCTVGTSS